MLVLLLAAAVWVGMAMVEGSDVWNDGWMDACMQKAEPAVRVPCQGNGRVDF
jgi:hypothetical protein